MKRENFSKNAWEYLGMEIPENTEIDFLVDSLKEAGIEKAVMMGQDMSRVWQTNFGEEYLQEVFRKYPDFFLPLISVEPLDIHGRFNRKALDYFERNIEFGCKGVLLTPPYGQYYSNHRTLYPFYEMASKHNVIVQFHHSAMNGPACLAPLKYANIHWLNDVIADFPELDIVVEHLAYPWYDELLVMMVSAKHLWTDLSQQYDRTYILAWNMVKAMEYGVVDRFMYASDFVGVDNGHISKQPGEDFKQWMNIIRYRINEICQGCGWPTMDEETINGILGNNAKRLYKL